MVLPISSVFFIVFGIVSIFLLIWNLKLEKRWQTLFKETENGSVDELLALVLKRTEILHKDSSNHDVLLDNIEKRLKQAIKRTDIVRFNAWGDTAGAQSFAIALVDETGTGVIISTLYARDRMTVFAKKITNWESENELTDEEQTALLNQKKLI